MTATATVPTTTTTTTDIVQEVTPEYKVFIGNLSFKTTKESLRAFAENTGGKVIEATIINKGTRSLGYGFVTFATEEDMKKAAVDLNHKELEGREINVEIARPKVVVESNESINDSKPHKAKRNTRQKSKASKKKTGKEEPASSSSSDGEEVSDNKKNDPALSTTAAAVVVVDHSKVSSESSSSEQSEEEGGLPTHRQKKNNRTKNKKKRSSVNNSSSGSKNNSNNKSKKSPTNTKRQGGSEPSKTTLFIANLPYATTVDDIKKIFEDYKIVSAHVTRMNNGRSKGYGFVEFENEEEQQRALQNVKDIVLDGRAVYLKVALSDQHTVTEKVEALDINDTKN